MDSNLGVQRGAGDEQTRTDSMLESSVVGIHILPGRWDAAPLLMAPPTLLACFSRHVGRGELPGAAASSGHQAGRRRASERAWGIHTAARNHPDPSCSSTVP